MYPVFCPFLMWTDHTVSSYSASICSTQLTGEADLTSRTLRSSLV
jgi:hypothetical protein